MNSVADPAFRIQLGGQFPTDVPRGGSATFTLQLDGSMVGSTSGEFSFSNRDPVDGYYQFGLSGNVNYPPPALTVQDGNTTLDNGSGSDDFGMTDAGSPVSKTFTIYNSSGSDIGIFGSPTLPQDFSVVGTFPTDVLARKMRRKAIHDKQLQPKSGTLPALEQRNENSFKS